MRLIYNIVLVPGVQQSDSVFHINMYLFRLFSIIHCYKILNIVPCVYSSSLWLIYFMYGSAYLLIPGS